MSDTWGALAQSLPAAATLTTAYTVPALKRGTIETIICNRGTVASVRLSHAIAGAADASAQYLLYDAPLDVGATKITARFTVAAGDVLRVLSDTGNVAFTVNGIVEDVT